MTGDRFFLTGRPMPPWADRRVVTVAVGCSLPFVESEWCDALVVVEGGEVDLECTAGRHRHFSAGAVLWLSGLSLRTIHNPGPVPTVLVAVSRRPPESG